MSIIRIFDKPMCCPTGVCGPQVDPILPRFAADLDWLANKGHAVERFNLAQQPEEFAKHTAVQELLEREGVDCLPLIIVDERVVSRSQYPSRENLAMWTGTPLQDSSLPIAVKGDCCGGSDCC